ncbi:hypothetical protein K3495_g10512 [Podosphaera aphanis]|nr:hypothetical protein K3495_g10512 [Podosphaera aphanis]
MHYKKRAFSQVFPDIGRWEDFLNEIKAWRPNEVPWSYVFGLDDELPSLFVQALEMDGDNKPSHEPLSEALSNLVCHTGKASGYTFKRSSIRTVVVPVYYSYSSQDTSREVESQSTGERDRDRIEINPYQSHFRFIPDLTGRRLEMGSRHNYHNRTADFESSAEVIDFIKSNSCEAPV